MISVAAVQVFAKAHRATPCPIPYHYDRERRLVLRWQGARSETRQEYKGAGYGGIDADDCPPDTARVSGHPHGEDSECEGAESARGASGQNERMAPSGVQFIHRSPWVIPPRVHGWDIHM